MTFLLTKYQNIPIFNSIIKLFPILEIFLIKKLKTTVKNNRKTNYFQTKKTIKQRMVKNLLEKI